VLLCYRGKKQNDEIHILKLETTVLLIVFAAFSSFLLLQKERPTLYIIGDSTVRNTNRPQCGWGEKIADFLIPTQLRISNQAMAGRKYTNFY